VSRPRPIRPRKALAKAEAPETLLANTIAACLEVCELWQRLTAAQRLQVRGVLAPLARVFDAGDLGASGVIRKRSKPPLR
jgi:hypothetical protein